MTRRPRIPMLPEELPQQRLYLVKGVPTAPSGWACSLGRSALALAPKTMPRSARYLGQVEWAWSPRHMRSDAYHLSMCSRHRFWVLWVKGYDDNWDRWTDPSAAAAGPRCSVPRWVAARLLLHDYWAAERAVGLDRFHWVAEEGTLDAGDLKALAAAVWEDGPALARRMSQSPVRLDASPPIAPDES